MSNYNPVPGSNMAALYSVLTDEFLTANELYEKAKAVKPDIPASGLNTNLRFLVKKNVIIPVKNLQGILTYKLNKTNEVVEVAPENMHGSKSMCVLNYCKQYIGKKIISKEVQLFCGKNDIDSAPLEALRRLKENGYIQLIPNTKPYEYLVLPDIKTLDTMPRQKYKKRNSIIQKNTMPEAELVVKSNTRDITQMNLGEIVSEYVTLKAENEKLKAIINRIAGELLHSGEIEFEK